MADRIALDRLERGDVFIFSPVSYSIEPNGDMTITCSLGNTYTAKSGNDAFIKNAKTALDSMEGQPYSLACYRNAREELDCEIM